MQTALHSQTAYKTPDSGARQLQAVMFAILDCSQRSAQVISIAFSRLPLPND